MTLNNLYDYMIRALSDNGELAKAMQLQHERILNEYQQREETKRFKEEIITDILDRISVKVDVNSVDELRQLLDEIKRIGRR